MERWKAAPAAGLRTGLRSAKGEDREDGGTPERGQEVPHRPPGAGVAFMALLHPQFALVSELVCNLFHLQQFFREQKADFAALNVLSEEAPCRACTPRAWSRLSLRPSLGSDGDFLP